MSILLSKFRETVEKNKDPRMKKEGQPDVLYPTGFPCFDFINGRKVEVLDKKTNQPITYYSLGIMDGSFSMFIGRSGSGKTTFTVQVAASIANQFPDADIYHDDIEGGASLSRRRTLTGWSNEKMKERYRYRNSGITAENFYETISIIKDIKLSAMNDLLYDTGLVDDDGEKIIKLQPTIYILDSLALLMPEKFTDEEELSGSMSSTAAAKVNSATFKRIIPMLKACNILLFAVNHITDAISINQFDKKKAQVSYLKPGESLPKIVTLGSSNSNIARENPLNCWKLLRAA